MHNYTQQNNDEQLRHPATLSDHHSIDATPAPTLNGNTAQRRAAVLQMQRQHGNAYVRRHIADLQRVDGAPAAGSDTATGATSIGDGSASISAQGGIVTIDASMVNINAPMTKHAGVDQSSTVMTNSVIAASYSPGAGNVW